MMVLAITFNIQHVGYEMIFCHVVDPQSDRNMDELHIDALRKCALARNSRSVRLWLGGRLVGFLLCFC